MKIVVQRVSEASVTVTNQNVGNIQKGLLLLVGITHDDDQNDIDYLVNKIVKMRIFNDEKNVMNLSLTDIQGELLIISQFTLHAKTKKGNRPSYIDAAKPEIAHKLYELFIEKCKSIVGDTKVAIGKFGADMKVALVNDGPVTIILDSKNLELLK